MIYDRPQKIPAGKKKDEKGVVKALIAVFIIILLLLLYFTVPAVKESVDGLMDDMQNALNDLGSGTQYPASAEFTVTRTIEINVSNGPVSYEIDVPIPEEIEDISGNTLQHIVDISQDPPASALTKYGKEWMFWSGNASGKEDVRITYHMETYTVWWDVDSKSSGTVNDIPASMKKYTDDEWKIRPSDPAVKSIADQLSEGTNNVYELVKKTYDYMDQNFEYEANKNSDPQDCAVTLNLGRGDCDDQSILMSSILRAMGIPAWLEFGTLYDEYRSTWGAHAWALVYIPIKEGGGGSVNIDIVNDEFLFKGANRITEWQSDGNADHLEDYYSTLKYSYASTQDPTVIFDEEYSGVYTPSKEKITI